MLKLHAFVALFAAIGAANAHGINPRHAHLKRQDTAASSSATAAPSGSVSASGSATASPASPSAPAGSQPAGGLASLSASRTDIPPLSEISSGMPTGTTYAATTTVQPGTVPTIADLDNAPAIPGFVFQMGEWPAQDKVPPTDSDEVKTWLKELEGFNIPDLEPTTDGYCASDPEFSGDAESRGWWTCGGWTRDTDILACPDKLTWGVSFDDGPGPYTVKLLDYLDEKDISATFFVVGSRVIERPDILKQEYTSGHEISVHSWSHSHLTKLTTEEIVAELGWTRRAIKEVLGVTPTTMRPPYGDIDDRVRAISLAMGMIPILWTKGPSGTFDTNDWSVPAGNVDGVESIQKFSAILGDAAGLDTGFIVLQHDLYEITVDLSIGYSLELAQSHNPPFTLLPIGQCAQIPTNDLYRETNTNSSFPSTEIDVAGDGSIVSDAAVGDSNGAMLLQLPSFVLGLAGFATLLCLL